MRNASGHLAAPLWFVLIAFVLLDVAAGQSARVVPEQPSDNDVFAPMVEQLNDAADRALAAALADKAWMKVPATIPVGNITPANISADEVVRLRSAIDRVRRLRPVVEPILREEGVPPELSAVILVESGGLPAALSPKGARGVWQLMPETARRYGLVVSGERDERLEVPKSTRAAARYLWKLHQQFGDWKLAFAAYNAGEQAVRRAMRLAGQPDFSALQSSLPAETRSYVPAVLDAMRILAGRADLIHGENASESRDRTHLMYALVGTED